MVVNTQVELLNDAFNIFKDASRKLEGQYAKLENRIEELNEELAEKNRAMERNRRLAAMGEMAAKIAHEIRNPLGSMSLIASILERELETDGAKKRLAERITKGVKTLDNILTNMLLFANSPGSRLQNTNLTEVIEDSLLLARGHDKDGVNVIIEFEGNTLIMGDEAQLRQMFINLFLNAFDAIGEDGTLSVRTRANGSSNSVEVEVKDTGSGIDQEHIDRIFDPFFSTKDRGTGLGLSIVSNVINSHKGYIDVTSIRNAGTTFLIGLPIQAEKEYRI